MKADYSIFSQRLKNLIYECELSQRDLADKILVNESTVSRYLDGTRLPKYEVLKAISDFFDVSIDYLFGLTNCRDIIKVHEPIIEVPILQSFKAKDNILDEKNIESYLTIPKIRFKNSDNLFALKINDDAMRPRLYEGDIVIVQRNEPLNNGDLGVFTIGDNEACIREYLNTGNGWLLNRLNPLCPPRHYTLDEIQQKPILCIGKVVESLTFFK